MAKFAIALFLVAVASCGGGEACTAICAGDASCSNHQVCRGVPRGSSCTQCLPATESKITAPATASRGATGLVASVYSDPLLHYRWAVIGGTLDSDPTHAQITFSAGTGSSMELACTLSNDGGDSNTVTATIVLQ